MVTITPRCQSEALVRNGHAPNGKQPYRCRACGRQSRENPTSHAYPTARREEILHASSRTQQSAWSHPHLWRLSHHRLQLDQKKVVQLPALCTTLLAPDPEDPTSTILELDKLWSCVLKKANDSWIWIALCRRTRQVVAYAVGDRSRQDVSAVVGGHSRGVSPGPVLYGLFERVYVCDSRGTTLRCRPARREKPPMSSAGIPRYANVPPVLSA
jgi:hypothetical protein